MDQGTRMASTKLKPIENAPGSYVSATIEWHLNQVLFAASSSNATNAFFSMRRWKTVWCTVRPPQNGSTKWAWPGPPKTTDSELRPRASVATGFQSLPCCSGCASTTSGPWVLEEKTAVWVETVGVSNCEESAAADNHHHFFRRNRASTTTTTSTIAVPSNHAAIMIAEDTTFCHPPAFSSRWSSCSAMDGHLPFFSPVVGCHVCSELESSTGA